MAHPRRVPSSFLLVVLSGIGTAAGLLIVAASFFFGGEERPDLAAAGAFFRQMRWMALGLTALCAALLAIGLSQHGGRPWPRALAVAAVVLVLTLAILAAMLVWTVGG